MPQTVISQQEFNRLKSNGSICICRSCLDNKNKIVVLSYEAGKSPKVISSFCPDCLKLISSCSTCSKK